MTKEELMRLLEPFDDALELYGVAPGGKRYPIFYGAYAQISGEGIVDLFLDGGDRPSQSEPEQQT